MGRSEREGLFSPSALGLGVVTAELAQSIGGHLGAGSARGLLLFGFWQAAALAAGALLFSTAARRLGLFAGRGLVPRLTGAALFAWFAAELGRTVWIAQGVCREQFGSNALIGVLPLLLLGAWQLEHGAIDRAARGLWWLLIAGAAACLIGLWGQLHWQRLFAAGALPVWQEGAPQTTLYPEYFAIALLCDERRQRGAAALPFWGYGVKAGYALLAELVLGRLIGPDYTGLELLRAWTLGYFSRLDALLLLVWLTGALWRVCMLVCVLRILWRHCIAPPAPGRLRRE